MVLKNIKNNKGFTIVELLIVIVVIGILAAITIVAYNGVQQRANTTKAQTAAKEVVNKAEVYAADNSGTYPTLAELTAATGTAALSAPTKTLLGATEGVVANATKPVFMDKCTAGGVKVAYWNFAASPAATSTEIFTAGDVSGVC